MPNKRAIKPQLGFLGFGLTGYIALGAAALILGLSVSLKVQSSRLASVKQEYAHFVADVKAKGEAAKVKADAEDKLNQKRKAKADADYKKLLAANTALNKRLRDNAGRSVLPDPGPTSGSAETACFGRPELDAALQRFIGGTAEIVISGQQATDALNNAKRWAQGQ